MGARAHLVLLSLCCSLQMTGNPFTDDEATMTAQLPVRVPARSLHLIDSEPGLC
jgi:hypothetical protein